MFLLPILALAIGVYVYTRDRAPVHAPATVGAWRHAPPRALPPHYAHEREPHRRYYGGGVPVMYADMAPRPACPPSPMAVLSEMIAAGRQPPAFVVECAIAEAELIGRYDLAYTLTQRFVLPALRDGGGAQPVIDATASEPALADDGASLPDAGAAQGPPPSDSDAGAGSVDSASSADPGAAPDVPSPISGVPDGAWSAMLGRLVREAPAYETQKHLGRYRHHKTRLAEVGFDATVIGGDPGLQDLAMSTDLADCFRHLHASGSLDGCVGAAITMPGQKGQVRATLSGVLGVCSVAGLEGAINWIERPADRERYPHTTMAFVRTNNIF